MEDVDGILLPLHLKQTVQKGSFFCSVHVPVNTHGKVQNQRYKITYRPADTIYVTLPENANKNDRKSELHLKH